jgi:hypothetical protein
MYASFDVATFNLLALGEKRLPLRVQEDPDSGFRILTVLYVFESWSLWFTALLDLEII